MKSVFKRSKVLLTTYISIFSWSSSDVFSSLNFCLPKDYPVLDNNVALVISLWRNKRQPLDWACVTWFDNPSCSPWRPWPLASSFNCLVNFSNSPSLTKLINAPFQSLGWAGKSLKNWRCHLWLHLRCFITLRTKHYSKFTSRHV